MRIAHHLLAWLSTNVFQEKLFVAGILDHPKGDTAWLPSFFQIYKRVCLKILGICYWLYMVKPIFYKIFHQNKETPTISCWIILCLPSQTGLCWHFTRDCGLQPKLQPENVESRDCCRDQHVLAASSYTTKLLKWVGEVSLEAIQIK